MLENTPTQSTMIELLGQPLFEVWQELCSVIDEKYDMPSRMRAFPSRKQETARSRG